MIPAEAEMIFYDGHCGLCHAMVRFVLRRDPSRFYFAPLHGQTFQRLVLINQRAGLPDTMVVRTPGGKLLLRSAAVIYILSQLTRGWWMLAKILRLAPPELADWVYDLVAKIRHRLSPPPAGICPVVPDNLRGRFEP